MRYLLLLLFLLVTSSTQLIQGQVAPTFEKNISLPEESGGFGFDIVNADGKLFVHAQNKIFVYNESNNNLITTIDLVTNNTTAKRFGKYSPPYFDYKYYSPSRQTMVVNENENVIYTLTPDLKIIRINVVDYSSTILAPRPDIISHFHISSGSVVIKHDAIHNRLYLLLTGRDAINSDGSFHMTDSYFAIYDIDELTGSLDLIHNELKKGISIADGGDGYLSTASDIEFNHNLSVQNNGDKFYIARKKRLEIWEFTGNPTEPVVLVGNPIVISAAKIGKLMTAKNNQLHKIIAIPYMLPGGGVEPGLEFDIKFYAIDGNSQSTICDSTIVPNKRVIDAVFLSGNNTLAMTYANDYLVNTNLIGTDIAFYKYEGAFVPKYTWKLNTNAYFQNNQWYNYNYPLSIVLGRNGDFYVGKRDEVVHITETGTEPAYEFTQVTDKQGAYFINGAKTTNNIFFSSLTMNGFYGIENYPNSISAKQCGFPVYESTYNPSNNKLYFYNTLNTSQSGIFVYNLAANNGNGAVETFIELDFPIGNVVYNPFQQHLLISSNTSESGIIRVLNKDNIFENDIIVKDVNHITQMFVAPNKQLSILANTTNTNPSLVVYNANNYSLVKNNLLNLSQISNNNFNADFCYNKYNNTIYATVTNTFILNSPYLSMKNYIKHSPNDGILLSISNTSGSVTTLKTGIRFPRKLICPEITNPPANYNGVLYINTGTNLEDRNNIAYYDCSNNSFEYVNFEPSLFFNDIVYNKATNSIIAFSDQTITTPELGEFANDRIARFYRIERTESEVFAKTEIGYYEGQIASFFINPYNGLLYVHTKTDKYKYGSTPSQLLQYDPLGSNNTFTMVDDLDVTSYYTEFDHFHDGLYGFYNYNLTTPYIDPVNNKIYIPNGAHSNVSVVNFEANETMLLNPQDQLLWLSFPRLNRDDDGAVDVNEVLLGNVEPDNYTDESELENRDKEFTNLDYSSFTGTEWNGDEGGLYNIQSSLGYKLYLDYNATPPDNVWVNLHGTVLDPKYSIPLYEDNENWTGYWIYQQQDIFDALADFKDQLYMIKHQDYFCYYGNANYSGGTPVPGQAYWWICDKLNRKIDYGEMVVLKAYDDVPAFQWNYSGNPPNIVVDEELEYYTYTETSDYSAFIIELDSTENPIEMGAFVNDSCIGACTLTPEDTLVIIKGYLGSQPGDSVVFEEYFAQKATNNKRIVDYFVYNSTQKVNEKRVIKTGENKDMYFISFKPGDEQKLTEFEYSFSIFPNPTDAILNINYSVENTTKVNISVCDIFGKKITTLLNEKKPMGTHAMLWNLTNDNGAKVPNGLYIIKLKINDVIISRKVVVN